MKPFTLLVILITTTSALAQSHLTTNINKLADTRSCPISLEAKHGQGSGMAEAGTFVPPPSGPAINGVDLTGRRPEGLYQQLHLTLINQSARQITGGRLTVHGLSAKWRTTELAQPENAPDLSKEVELSLDLKGNSRTSRDLSLSRFTAVTSIELNEITYAGGTVWHATAAGSCTVIPDALMLLSANQ